MIIDYWYDLKNSSDIILVIMIVIVDEKDYLVINFE